ncbi:MAG: aspartyl protease family protein [Planctomycetes bacterium]|nr:aspartyl protease family protein [Planctomycetota bacterium]
MGHVYVNAKVKGKRQGTVRFLVDTGATYCLVPEELARKLGLFKTPMRQKVRLADGKTVRLPVAGGLIRLDGREAATWFWIGRCDEPLLGVETLEVLGLEVDPKKRRLKAVRPYATRLGGFGRR